MTKEKNNGEENKRKDPNGMPPSSTLIYQSLPSHQGWNEAAEKKSLTQTT